EAREGKLSEFFEPEIEYIWLKDDSEDSQLGNLNKVFFHEDKIFTLDIFGCKCIQIFDKSGSFLSKIHAYGDGPEKYMDFDDATV
ncbi:6-bladed beta-propeller, partial [Campylobacter fetus subsp. venerealis]